MCNCWEKMNKELEKQGLRLSSACEAIRMKKNGLEWMGVLPLQTVDGKKPGKKQVKVIEMTHCPFCGQKME